MFVIALIFGIIFAAENMYFIFSVPIIVVIILSLWLLNRLSLRYNYRKRTLLKRTTIISIGLILGSLLIHFIDISAANSVAKYSGRRVILTGNIASIIELKDRIELTLTNITLDEEIGDVKLSGKLKLMIPSDYMQISYNFSQGDLIKAGLKISEYASRNNYSEPDYTFLNLTKGIHAISWADSESFLQVIQKSQNLVKMFLEKIRAKIESLIENLLIPERSIILSAVLFGKTSLLTEDMISSFRRTGTSHILSVSGLHISSLVALFSFVLSDIPIKKTIKTAIILLLIFIYISFTSLGISVIRSLIYLILISLAKNFGIVIKKLSIFSATMTIHLLIFPLHLYNVGFQFSYVCVFTLMFIIPIYVQSIFSKVKSSNLIKTILKAALTSLLLQIVTLPLVINLNNEIFIASWTLNLVIVPIVVLSVPLAMIGIIFGIIYPTLASFPLNISSAMLVSVKNLTSYIANLNWGFYTIATLPITFIILYYLLFLLIAAVIQNQALRYKAVRTFKKHIKIVGIFITSIILAILIQSAISYRSFKIDFINVGNGDATLIKGPFQKIILIDGGDLNSFKDYGKSVVMPFLKSRGINKIDVLIMTHSHSDHAGGLKYILENMDVEACFVSAYEPLNELGEELINLALSKGAKIYRAVAGSSLILGGVQIDFINPPKDISLSENDTSLAFKISYKKISAIFTGDMEVKAEEYIVEAFTSEFLNADILKVAHHGSKTSSGEAFLDVVHPKYAVISVGKNNYGHPAPEVLTHLYERNIQIFRTDNEGTISFKYSLGKLEVRIMRNEIEKIPLFRALADDFVAF